MKLLQNTLTRKILATAILCIATALLTTHFSFQELPQFTVGEVATQDVEASMQFDYVDEEAWAERKREVAAEQIPIYDLDVSKKLTLAHRINTAFGTARQAWSQIASKTPEPSNDLVQQTEPSSAQQIQQTFEDTLGLQLSSTERQAFIETEWSIELQQASLRLLEDSMQFYIIDVAAEIPKVGQRYAVHRQFEQDQDVLTLTDARNVKTLTEVRQYVSVLAANLPSYNETVRMLGTTVARQTVQVNFTYNHLKTEQERRLTTENTPAVVRRVNLGQSIVRKGDVVDSNQAMMLNALLTQQVGGASSALGEFIVKLMMAAFVVVSLYLFSINYIRKFASSVRDVEAMAILSVFVLLVSRLLVMAAVPLSEMVGFGMGNASLWYATPIAAGTLVLRILTNSETTIVWAIGMALLLAFGMGNDVFLACFFMVTGITAAATLAHTRDRINLLRAGLQTGLLGAAMALLIAFYHAQTDAVGGIDNIQPLWDVLFCLAGGVTSAFLALGLLPLFEGMGFVTDYKMLELANLNHPLLRQLFVQAPGTYHHSMIMAQLSEAAAEAIGANALHAKIACYYHDIGKSLQPQFFIENQRGTNPHDNLEPHQSARVIKTHVVDGIVMAKQHGLPQPILDAIEMHHGTSLMKYFYIKAMENAVDGEVVDEADFRYSGKRPSTREAGIIFLADRVEAACRTLKEPSHADFQKMISKLVNSAITEQQFEECPLTLKELYIIMDVFTTTMTNMYHQRIEYPKMPPNKKSGGIEVSGSSIITLERPNPLLTKSTKDEPQTTDATKPTP